MPQVSVEDISALCVVADRHAPFAHTLNLKYLYLRWVLDEDDDGSSPVRFRSHAASVKPKHILSIDSVDFSLSEEQIEDTATLITSPRSALVLLKNGFGLPDVLSAPERKIRNQALLDGADRHASNLRVSTENERRRKRRELVMREYEMLCRSASRDDIVGAMREQYFARHRQKKQNKTAVKSELKPLAPPGKLDLSELDADAIVKVEKSRAAAATEVIRVIEQSERQRDAALRKERALVDRDITLRGEAEKTSAQHEAILEEKRQKVAQRREAVMHRVAAVQHANDQKREEQRTKLLEDREATRKRANANRKMTVFATQALVLDAARRRQRVRQSERDLIEERRMELESRMDLKTELQARHAERQEELRERRRRETAAADRRRRNELKHRAAQEAEAKNAKIIEMSEAAEQRQREIIAVRAARQEMKMARAAEKVAKGNMIRAVADARREQELVEREQRHAEKARALAAAVEERARVARVLQEEATEQKNERKDERDRTQAASEFSYVAYVGATTMKGEWLAGEALKRETLQRHVKQEREALGRAKDEVLQEVTAAGVQESKRIVNASQQVSTASSAPVSGSPASFLRKTPH